MKISDDTSNLDIVKRYNFVLFVSPFYYSHTVKVKLLMLYFILLFWLWNVKKTYVKNFSSNRHFIRYCISYAGYASRVKIKTLYYVPMSTIQDHNIVLTYFFNLNEMIIFRCKFKIKTHWAMWLETWNHTWNKKD